MLYFKSKGKCGTHFVMMIKMKRGMVYMKVVAAIDSFKGSLTSMEAGSAVKEGVLAAFPEAEVVVKPLADGGEGTTDALIDGMGGKRISIMVTGPVGNAVQCSYGIFEDRKLAVMEMAAAAGITLLPDGKGDPLHATTRGVGEMILDAVGRGCRDFIIGIGGSATNDGGLGMLKALGFRITDCDGKDVGEGARALGKVAHIDLTGAEPLLRECAFRIACDVTNPLCGENGATYVFGPQKGVKEEWKASLDAGMKNYAKAACEAVGRDCSQDAGAGAAGGLGFAFKSFLNADLTPGVQLVLDAISLEEELKDADIVVTGEGRLDFQTAMGKAPVGVAALGKKYGVKVIAFAGSVTPEASACNHVGIDAFFPVIRSVCTLEEAMKRENAYENLKMTAEQVFRLIWVWY